MIFIRGFLSRAFYLGLFILVTAAEAKCLVHKFKFVFARLAAQAALLPFFFQFSAALHIAADFLFIASSIISNSWCALSRFISLSSKTKGIDRTNETRSGKTPLKLSGFNDNAMK
jgi:hypothetical protein